MVGVVASLCWVCGRPNDFRLVNGKFVLIWLKTILQTNGRFQAQDRSLSETASLLWPLKLHNAAAFGVAFRVLHHRAEDHRAALPEMVFQSLLDPVDSRVGFTHFLVRPRNEKNRPRIDPESSQNRSRIDLF